MSNCQDNRPTFLPEAVWKALINLPALRYMKAPVDTVAQLYEKYPIGNEKGTFAFVHNENTFYTYYPRGWHRGEWKPIPADGISSFFEIDAEFLKEGDILVYDSNKKKFVVKSGNVWNKLLYRASSFIQINRFFNEVDEIPTIDSDQGVYFVHKNTESETGTVEFRALYIVLDAIIGKKVVKIWNSSDYLTKEETQTELNKRANQSQVDDIAASVDTLAVNKAEKSVVDAILNGYIKQLAVDTYNDTTGGKTSLLNTYPNPQVGWDVLVREENTRYNWNGTQWVNMETGVYDNDVARKEDLLKIESQLSFTTAFDMLSADSQINGQTSTLWCNDYWAKTVLGIQLKARTGTLYIRKLNIKTKDITLIKEVEILASQNATLTTIFFDDPVTLEEYERIGLNGSLFYTNSASFPLFPNMYTYRQATNDIIYQKDATMSYALIIPDRDREQILSDRLEKITTDIKNLENKSDGEIIGESLPTLAGGSDSGSGGGGEITTCSYLQAKSSGVIEEITINTMANTDNHIVIFSLIDNIAYEKDRVILRSTKDGIYAEKVNININLGDYVGFYKAGSKFTYKVNVATPGVEDCRFLQLPVPNVVRGVTNLQGWVGLSYKLKPNSSIDTGIIQNGYESGIFQSGLIAPRDSYSSVAADKWITFNQNPFSYEGIVKKLWIDVETAGDITLGIGIIDQRTWAIIDSEQTVNVPNAGLNEVDINIPLTENQRLFIKSPVSIGLSATGTHLETGASTIVLEAKTGELLFKYQIEGKRFVSTNLATKQDIAELKEDIAAVDYKVSNISFETLYPQSDDGSFWKLGVDNAGAVTTTKVTAKKVSVFGNSFERHPITSFWWGDWGMAASTRENDWIHRLMSKLRLNGILTNLSVQNIATWETNAATFNYPSMDSLLPSDLDLAIIRIGENNPNSATLTDDTKTLIDYIRSKVPNVPIIFGGVFWTNASKQAKLQAAVSQYADIPFIDFQILDKAEYKSSVGALVYGDDGQWHTITNTGVANHAGDLGMDEMANMMLPYSINKLQ